MKLDRSQQKVFDLLRSKYTVGREVLVHWKHRSRFGLNQIFEHACEWFDARVTTALELYADRAFVTTDHIMVPPTPTPRYRLEVSANGVSMWIDASDVV